MWYMVGFPALDQKDNSSCTGLRAPEKGFPGFAIIVSEQGGLSSVQSIKSSCPGEINNLGVFNGRSAFGMLREQS